MKQYTMMRFKKYKGPAVGACEAHNERTAGTYGGVPDIDSTRSHLNFHLVTPRRKYQDEAKKQIEEAQCQVRGDSVQMVEMTVTASPAFFQGKDQKQIRAFFQAALAFLIRVQNPKTVISAVVHMDEEAPHMHLCFVPITNDGRLCAKEIVGDRAKLIHWQDAFWAYMVRKFPALEEMQEDADDSRKSVLHRIAAGRERSNIRPPEARSSRSLPDGIPSR